MKIPDGDSWTSFIAQTCVMFYGYLACFGKEAKQSNELILW